LIEYVYNIQGLGLLFINALGTLDYQILLAYVLLGSFLTVLGNLIADIAMTFADPRIRLD
jgi:peptide/nickel transport system permease protein